MTGSTGSSGVWDFDAALSLINSAYGTGGNALTHPDSPPPPSLTHSDNSDKTLDPAEDFQTSLGNFDKLWQFLGTSAPTASYAELAASERDANKRVKLGKEEKNVKWVDEQTDIFAQAADTLNTADTAALAALTKTQRKRERRRLRKLLGTTDQTSDDEEERTTTKIQVSKVYAKPAHAVSDGEFDLDAKVAFQRSKERQGIIQQIITETPKKAKKVTAVTPHDLFLHQVAAKQNSAPATPPRYNLRSSLGSVKTFGGPPESVSGLTEAFNKKRDLLQLLFSRFQSDLQTLSGLSYSYSAPEAPSNTTDPSGIHVFVDISNILISFHDALKLKKGLSKTARFPRQKLSFYNLSLIMERGRLVSKRCLAGSDMLECIEEARQIGYDTNILERVTKEKLLTPRQRYFRAKDRGDRSGASSGGEHFSGPGSGTDDEPQMVTRRVEQAVDEILHLNMMLSLVDTKEPSTIVLASGDAAAAEYSQGFLSMCERALERGWKVELVAFKHNMSYAYKRKEWGAKWGGRFKIIELDEYAEMLRL